MKIITKMIVRFVEIPEFMFSELVNIAIVMIPYAIQNSFLNTLGILAVYMKKNAIINGRPIKTIIPITPIFVNIAVNCSLVMKKDVIRDTENPITPAMALFVKILFVPSKTMKKTNTNSSALIRSSVVNSIILF